MATDTIYLTGWLMWAKVHSPDKEYKNFTVDFYPEDIDETRSILKEQESQLKEKEAQGEGTPGPYFYKFRRAEEQLINDQVVKWGPPLVVRADSETPEKRLLGNGTKATVKLEFFDTKNGRGHRLIAVKIDELVEYNSEGPREVKHLPF